MWLPTSCSSAAYSSHSRSRAAEPVEIGGLVEEGERELGDVLAVRHVVLQPPRHVEDAATARVGNRVALLDLLRDGAG